MQSAMLGAAAITCSAKQQPSQLKNRRASGAPLQLSTTWVNLAQWGRFVLFKGFTMFQPEKTSLKQDIAFILAIAAAGFKLTDSKSVDTHDGAAWHATLTHGRTKIVTVSNGGHGGPDESHFHATTDAGKAVDIASLKKLFAIPEVAAAVRGHMLFNLDLEQQYNKVAEFDYAAAQTDIADRVPAPTEDNVEFLVGRIADITGTVNSFKRASKTKLLVVFEGGDAKGEYVTYKLTDTPANRERVQAHEKRKIDYFVSDLFSTTNQPVAA
jgi:hypothetical protein